MKKAVLLLSIHLAISATAPFCIAGSVRDAALANIRAFEVANGNSKAADGVAFVDRMRALFPGNGINLIKTSSIEAGRPKTWSTIYIGDRDVEIVANSGEWNLSVDEIYTYEWKEGDKTGIRIKRSDKDLVVYLYYLTDPGWIMAGLYNDYVRNPKAASIRNDNGAGYNEVTFEKAIDGFEALYVREAPLWFCGFRARNNKGEAEFHVSMPRLVPEIPALAKYRWKVIKFRDSEETLQQRMAFL